MINFCIPTDFSERFLKEINNLNNIFEDKGRKIIEIYGSLATSFVGSARSGEDVPEVSFHKLKEHIKLAKSYNLQFNYLFNASCLYNKEYTIAGRSKIIQFLDELVEAGIDRITVTIPYIMELIKVRYPKLPITASVICFIDTPERAKFYEDIGVDRITLDIDINRNFEQIVAIRKKVKVGIEVLVNSSCILNCPMKHYHYNVEAHLSQEEQSEERLNINPSKDHCMIMLLSEPYRFISSPFIRPEDVYYYKELGINYFKIVGREYKAKYLLPMAESYLKGEHTGNLISILGAYLEPTEYKIPLELYIDNKRLDGFLDFFKKRYPCDDNSCVECGYCLRIAKEALFIAEDKRKEYIKLYKEDLSKSYILKNNLESPKDYSLPARRFALGGASHPTLFIKHLYYRIKRYLRYKYEIKKRY